MDTIRTYRPDDFSACLALFNDNVPTFFSAGERADFVHFLTHHAATWHYQVIERAGQVVACAGYSISTNGTTASAGAWSTRDCIGKGWGQCCSWLGWKPCA